jgi:hypothetical protein
LLRHSGNTALQKVRRDSSRTIRFNKHRILIRDQKPLHEGAIDFEPGWDLARLVQHINKHVFFWPGSSISRPVEAGLNHYERYAQEELTILRVRWCAVLRTNSHAEPLFSKFNSGAPRTVDRKHSRRGSNTYRDRHNFSGGVSDVVEVVFLNKVTLPCDTQVSVSYAGPWKNLNSD